jgi:hypothetical protein
MPSVLRTAAIACGASPPFARSFFRFSGASLAYAAFARANAGSEIDPIPPVPHATSGVWRCQEDSRLHYRRRTVGKVTREIFDQPRGFVGRRSTPGACPTRLVGDTRRRRALGSARTQASRRNGHPRPGRPRTRPMPCLRGHRLGGEGVSWPGALKPAHFELAAPGKAICLSRLRHVSLTQSYLMLLQSDSLGLPCDVRFSAVAMRNSTVYAYQSGRLMRIRGHQ